MNVVFHKRFDKMASKLSSKVKEKMVERITRFSKDPLDYVLRNHALNTPYKGSYGIDVTGDYRAIYYLVDDETAMFTHIGTHSQLYK
ncbi:MAG TPA: type II toxin-antitoxin system mRNA interferase toxin, RelE/StbE family [Candidatus Saccharimonadales bacterium]|nr:type II toxin-antitoxin system mRNA interferase toxin, RelE/StbE family [Candidatus Saccharimonadales bacterium]